MRVKGGAAPAAWAPTDLADIKYWWKPESITTPDGDGIYEWLDEIASLDLAQATGSKKPALASSYLNGLDGSQFDGIDDLLQTATFTAITNPFVISGIWGKASTAEGAATDGDASRREHRCPGQLRYCDRAIGVHVCSYHGA